MRQIQGSAFYRNIFLCSAVCVVLVLGFVAFGCFLRPKANKNQHIILQHSTTVRVDQFDEVKNVSYNKTMNAVQLFRAKEFQQGIDELIDAINIFPLNTDAYKLLVHAYLASGQEKEMYYALDRAGDSYANFDDIVSVIDDADLDNIPLDEPKDNIFLANFPENKRMAISFCFDDGEESIYDHLNIFEKYGFRATLPIVAGFVGTSAHWGTWAEWKDAANRGFEIANHSMYHRDISRLSGKDLSISINKADALIENKIGREVTAFVFPGGSISSDGISHALQVSEVIRSSDFLGRFYNRTMGIVYGGPYFSLKTANRLIDIGIKRRLWIDAKGHGITANPGVMSYKPIDPSVLDEHLSYIHSKLNDIYVDTFSHVFEYLQVRHKTRLEIRGFSSNSAEFVLRGGIFKEKLSIPLTVVLKAHAQGNMSAQTQDGKKLYVWSCAIDQLCVDVSSYDQNILVQWT